MEIVLLRSDATLMYNVPFSCHPFLAMNREFAGKRMKGVVVYSRIFRRRTRCGHGATARMDMFTKERRAEIMARITGKDTTPEMRVRRLLHGMGYRFRLHRKDLPGTPNLVLTKWKTVVLVHGCFWHGHTCHDGHRPKSKSFGMNKPSGTKHANYEILNLIGYGLAKFDRDLVAALGYKTKAALFHSLIQRGVAETRGTLKNRQDLFNPLLRNAKIGWWQNKERYLHRKILLDSLFGDLDAIRYSAVVENYLQTFFPIAGETPKPIVPILKSKFRQLQETGSEAELFFMNCFKTIERFKDGVLEDARLFGDGYDFQITIAPFYILAEVKGLRGGTGGIRLTENEFLKAKEFKNDYCLAVVSHLEAVPRISVFFNPLDLLPLTKQTIVAEQVYYLSPARRW